MCLGTPSSDTALPDLKEYFDQNSVIDQSADSVPIEDPQVKGSIEDWYCCFVIFKNVFLTGNEEVGVSRQYSIADFELIRVIGRGSYAKVLMVELKKTKCIYAMKVIKKALVTDDEVSINTIEIILAKLHQLNQNYKCCII